MTRGTELIRAIAAGIVVVIFVMLLGIAITMSN